MSANSQEGLHDQFRSKNSIVIVQKRDEKFDFFSVTNLFFVHLSYFEQLVKNQECLIAYFLR